VRVRVFVQTFVEKLKWFSHAIFLEVLALCQCMPGPTSTQVSFALGTFKHGTLGGLTSGLLFNYPGAIILTLLGVGLGDFIVNAPEGGLAKCVIAGLSAVGVALVATACVGLCRGACKDNVTVVLCTLAAAATTFSSSVYVLPIMLVIGALTTLTFKWREEIPPKEDVGDIKYGLSPMGGAFLFVIFFSLLGLSFAVDHQSWVKYADNPFLFWFASFYRVGALIFGGGQVMIPLLINVVIQYNQVCTKLPDGSTHCKMEESKDSWVTTDQFYAGLAAAQVSARPFPHLSPYNP
jgi:chromate transporter